MPSPFLRIFLLYNLINAILLSLVPKKLRFLLPPSWYHPHQLNNLKCNNVVDHSISQSTTFSSCVSSSQPAGMDSVELKKVFDMFDHNEDGKVSKEELSQSLKNLGIFMVDTELHQLIEKIDVNGDGCLDINEFGELYTAIMEEHCGGDDSKEEDMKEAFDVFDQNGDGFITVEELRSVLETLGVKQGKTMEDCKRMILNVDVDGDGMVSFKEFQLMMKGGTFAALS